MARSEKKYSPFDCQSWCRDTNGCFYFTFNLDSSTCFLKGADAPGTEREYPGDMVGPKEFCSGGGEDVETEEESESGTGSDGAESGAGSEGEEELKCFHPINWKSIARTLKTESGVKDAAACQRLCAKEDQCTHFNYHTDSHSCELKIKNGSDVVEAANVITGPKTCSSSCFTLGVGHTAKEMARSEKKYSPFDCQSWCRDTNGCFYFTFNRNSSTCFLKGADAPGTEREYPGDMVGPKEFCSGGGEDVETEEESESGTGSDGAESGAGSEG
ncbi:PAN domain-containing protein, partial [Toxoplasma gondii ARI]